MTFSKSVSSAETAVQDLIGDGEPATTSGPAASDEARAMVSERLNIDNGLDSDDEPPEAGSDLESASDSESDSDDEPPEALESASDSESDSDRGMLRYLSQLDGHRKWRGADGTHNDLRNCFIRPDDLQVTFDDVKSSGLRNLMVMAASNRPFDIDEGVLRRPSRRILVDLPAKNDREAILKIHLRDEDLARVTGDYSGSDLRDLVHEAALISLREMESSRSMNLKEERRMLQWKHFQAARRQIRPSPKSDTVEKIRDFHNKFGNLSQRPAVAPMRSGIINRNVGTPVENRY